MDSLKTEKIRLNKQADVFINKTATLTLTNPDLVERVMNFHFRDLVRAMSVYSSIEISGFGKFVISHNKLMRKLTQLKRIHGCMVAKLETGNYIRSEEQMNFRIKKLEHDIEYLEARSIGNETKLQEYFKRMSQETNNHILT